MYHKAMGTSNSIVKLIGNRAKLDILTQEQTESIARAQ